MRVRPRQWPPLLLRLRGELEEVTGQEFNSALVNLYRDHRDHLPWHSDNEPCLREQPVIASISLGEMRYFELRKQASSSAIFIRYKDSTSVNCTISGLTMYKGIQSLSYIHHFHNVL